MEREKIMGGIMEKATKRERMAWYFYDFGNSAYAAVVILAVYSAYYKGTVVGGAEGSRLWGLAVGIAMLLVAVTAPLLGTIADYSGSRKTILFFLTAQSVIFTAALFFVQEGDALLGMVLLIMAESGYRGAQVFYNSLLPDIASPEEISKVSGNGWAIGSLGGILCLLMILPVIVLIGGTLVVRLSLVFTAIFFAASTAPLFLWLKERGEGNPLPEGETYFSLGFKRLFKTFRAIQTFKEFIRFIVAFLVANNGIVMALNFAAILGAVLFGMEQQELIIFMIIVQVTSVVGAYVFGMAADRYGAKKSLLLSLLLMIAVVLWMYVNNSKPAFYVIGAMAGLALTGVQSVSRTMVGLMAPQGKSGEFYGFFAVAGRSSSFIGPAVYGWLAAEAALFYERQGLALLAAEQAGQRLGILSIALFLVVGFVMLLFIHEPESGYSLRKAASLAVPDPE